MGRTLKAIVFFFSLPSKKSLSVNGDRNKSKAPHAAFSSPSSPRKTITFLVFAKPPEARPYTSCSWSLIPKKILNFLYSLLKSPANAVLILMSAVIAIAHVLFVSIKSLSFSIMLLEYSFGKLKYDSTTPPMSCFLGPSFVSASRSAVFLAIFNFVINNFPVWISPSPLPGQKYPSKSPSIAYRILS